MDYLEPLFRAAIAVAGVIALTRLNGLRSFSKMTSFDFALTVATGSIIAATILNIDQHIWIGLMSLVSVFVVQAVVSRLRFTSGGFQKRIENEPLLLLENGEFLTDNLTRSHVTKGDIYGKLREANALSMAQVRAVVLEPTGDISVLHCASDDTQLDEEILTGVRRR